MKQNELSEHNILSYINKKNIKDEFNSQVVVDGYIRYFKKELLNKGYHVFGRRCSKFIETVYSGMKKSNMLKRKQMILNDSFLKIFQVQVIHNKNYFIQYAMVPCDIKDNSITYEILSTVFDIKNRTIINTSRVAATTIPFHALERYIERAEDNSIMDMLHEINLLMKVQIMCTYVTHDGKKASKCNDVATKLGVWMGDSDEGVKTFVDKDNLHSFDMGYLKTQEQENIEKAFDEYVFLCADGMPLYDKRTFKSKIEIDKLEKFLTTVVEKYKLSDYFSNWNVEKEKRLIKRSQYCYST
jgi:hypothetical protein